jgi:preprotein translocase subunit SecY
VVVLILIVFMVLVTAFIVYMERAQRRIPVQYAKRVMGRKVYGGQSTYLPLRVNTGGVIPVIFASSVVMVPTTLASFWPESPLAVGIADHISWGQPLYYLLEVVAIVFFSFFYVSIIFNPVDLAENMRKYGGFIPGIRTGKRTSEYIDSVLTRITTVGALYLAAVTVLPEFLLTGIKLDGLPVIGPALDSIVPSFVTTGLGINFYFGGTSLLIIVGVAMDFLQQVESQLVMRNYEGFMKRGRIRGRR